MRLEAWLEGPGLELSGTEKCGVMTESDTPIALRLQGSSLHFGTDYMNSCELSDTKACQRVVEMSFWNGKVE